MVRGESRGENTVANAIDQYIRENPEKWHYLVVKFEPYGSNKEYIEIFDEVHIGVNEILEKRGYKITKTKGAEIRKRMRAMLRREAERLI